MYNEQLKEAFIAQCSVSRASCLQLFNSIEKYENVWGADVCTRSGEELQPVVDSVMGIRALGRMQRYNILRDYIMWCVEQNVPGARSDILDVDTEGVAKMRAHTVASPLHLQTYLNGLFLRESEQTRDNIVRAYCWLAYIGMREEDAAQTRADEVDFNMMVVRHGEREYPICSESVPSLRNCKELSFFYRIHPNYPDKPIINNRVSGELLLRETVEPVSVVRLRKDLSDAARRKANKANNCADTKSEAARLSYYRIWLSGLFYRAYTAEIVSGVEPDFAQEAADHVTAREHDFSGARYNEHIFYNKIKLSYLNDYKVWKKAYKL